MYFVTLGHFLASSCASALVTLRQLLSPKPSASASVISFDPHQLGAPATGLPPPSPPLSSSSLPQSVAPIANTAHAASPQKLRRFHRPLIVLLPRLLFDCACGASLLGGDRESTSRATPQPHAHALPRHAVDREADDKRACLDEVLQTAARTACEEQLVELRQEQGGNRARGNTSPSAEQRCATEHHGGNGRQQVGVALEGARRRDDPSQQDAGGAVEERREDVCARLVPTHDEPSRPRARVTGSDALEAPAGDGLLHDESDEQCQGDGDWHRYRDTEDAARGE